MNLKNYTSGIPADRSVSRIETLLVALGATNINKAYVDGKLSSISFMVIVNGNTIPFKLPARIEAVEKVMRADIRRPRKGTMDKLKDQAERTAWKIICDWVEVQGTMIKLQQAEFIEVFMPYVFSLENNQTFFERMKEKNYKALLN
jgi:hypothetical protein